ncbi:hypothetical protein E2C01_062773 [Portunus trituberculatus]|uniref:Uncharacterized protein n=1 Tax=Portunus trituberculatus TaxID=210409 RepID=A0A5B7H7E7_PORTR|nr:hypothetical protein [Portunus trituberculatus]
MFTGSRHSPTPASHGTGRIKAGNAHPDTPPHVSPLFSSALYSTIWVLESWSSLSESGSTTTTNTTTTTTSCQAVGGVQDISLYGRYITPCFAFFSFVLPNNIYVGTVYLSHLSPSAAPGGAVNTSVMGLYWARRPACRKPDGRRCTGIPVFPLNPSEGWAASHW